MATRGRLFLSTSILLTIGACATTQEPGKLVDVRPAKFTADPAAKPSDPLYMAAVSAIERRDYALALDALQAARARSPDDARVWNAMGVVYDKLGRFDLSARYYAQAQELDPGSRVVSQNLAYSAVLQGKQAEPRALAAAAPQVSPPAVTVARPAAPPPPEARVAMAATAAVSAPPAPPIQQAPVVAKVTQAAPAPRSVLQVVDGERAQRLAATSVLTRWAAPVLEAFDPKPAAASVAPAPSFAKPTSMVLSASPPTPRAPTPTPVAMARVTAPAAPAQTVARAPGPDRAPRFASVTEPLSRLAAPVLEILASAAPAPARAPVSAEHGVRTAPVQTVTLSATPRPAATRAPAVRVATVATPARRPVAQRTAPAVVRPVVAPIRVATPTARITLARASTQTNSLLGRPLLVVNASGRRGGAEPVRLKLASRGWTAPVSVVRPGTMRATSTIRYASRNVIVARALARTLPYRVRLESCGTSCRGVTLFVGADALRWRGGPMRTRAPAVYRGRA